MTPHQGAGAGQAIEVRMFLRLQMRSVLNSYSQDAFVLAELLGSPKTTMDNLDLALKSYEHIRLPMATHVMQGSRDSGRMYEFNGPQGETYSALGPAIQNQWNWLQASTPEEDAERALTWMQSNI